MTLKDEITKGHARGWSYTPLGGADGKKPILDNWPTLPREALADALRWAEAGNVGLRTGGISGIFGVDWDAPALPPDSILPKTWTVLTGRNRYHLIYAYFGPWGNKTIPDLKKYLNADVGEHHEIRGDGGQLVAVGCVNPQTGGEYRWMPGRSPDDIPLAAFPLALLPRDWKAEQALKLHREGKVFRDIADAVGCGAGRVKELLELGLLQEKNRSAPGAQVGSAPGAHDAKELTGENRSAPHIESGSAPVFDDSKGLTLDLRSAPGVRSGSAPARTLPPHPNSQTPNQSAITPYFAYVKKCFDDNYSAVAKAPTGTRNSTLNTAAFNLGQLVPNGYTTQAEIEAVLTQAACECGLDTDPNCGLGGIKNTIDSGLAAGMRQPKTIEPARRQSPPAKPAPHRPSHPPTLADYVLIPGLQVTADGSEERGTHHFADDCLSRLPEDALYRMDWMPGQIVGNVGELRFKPLDNPEARLLIDGRMRLGKWVEAKEKDEDGNKKRFILFLPCSQDCAGLFLSRAGTSEQVRKLQQIVNYPIYRTDWTLAPAGWNEEIYYDQPAELASIEPIKDVEVIQGTLYDLLIDFPFKSEADRQNFIGLLLTPIIRSAIAGNIPLHLILSPRPRSGKGKLAEQVLGIIITGKPTLTAPLPKTEEEQEKRIATKLMDCDPLAHLDNINHFLDSAVLASLLTARVFACRVLGASKQLKLPNNLTLVGTGNNVRATEEMVKRIIPVCLQPLEENPEERDDFHHPNLPKYLREIRPKVLACLLGMVQIWIEAGMPEYGRPLGGFEEWSSALGGIMTCSGFNDWRANEKQWRRDADPRGEDLRVFVDEWWTKWQTHEIGVQWLLELAKTLEVFPDVLSQKDDRVRQTMLARRILVANTDVNTGGKFIRRKGSASNSQYFLEAPNGPGSAT